MGMKQNRQSSEESGAKKDYRPPRLVAYGNLRALTSGPKGGKKSDGPDGRAAFNTRQ
jgi:hypothetical protein